MKGLLMWSELVLSAGANALAMAAEGTRVIQEGLYLVARRKAEQQGQLSAFEGPSVHCPYYLPGSDFPTDHFLGDVWPIILHILLFWLFLVMFAADLPWHWCSKRLSQWADAFGFNVSTWVEGATQMLAASIMVGLPYGNQSTMLWRLSTGYTLYVAGLGNIVVGALFDVDNELRRLRHQVETHADIHTGRVKAKWLATMGAFLEIDAALQNVQIGGDYPGLMEAKNRLRKAIRAGLP